MGLFLLSTIYLRYTAFPDILLTIPSTVPINPGFRFDVFVALCGVVFVKLLNGTKSAENGAFF